MKMGKKVREYKSGDFIFAKVKGYPAWPARVQKMNGKKYFVYFYGTGETANLPPNMIFDYAENKDKFLTKTQKRRDFNDGVKQIEYDFANNVPLEQVIGVPMEVPVETNDSALDSAFEESVAEMTADDTLTNNTTADETNTTQNDGGVEDSDDAGNLVIDEGKAVTKGRKSTAKTPAKDALKPKEPKTPRGKKKEEAKEEELDKDKKEEEIVSRSGRKIRPKRYIDEETEDSSSLPSPAPKKRRGASPTEKDKDTKDGKSKNEKNIMQFNAVKQSEIEGLKEPFKPVDEEKDNILIAYLPDGSYVGIKLFQSRPTSFKNEQAKLQWDKQAASNAITLKYQLEREQITPESVQGQLVMDLNLTDEEKATLDKERETEEKKARLQFLKTEMRLIELDSKIKTCLSLEKANTERCLKLLDDLLSLFTAMEVRPLMLLKHPTCLETVKRMRAYVGNTPSWDLNEKDSMVFNKQAHKIRRKADTLYQTMKSLFSTPEGLSFWEYFSEQVVVFKKATSNLNATELLEMVHEPLEMTQPGTHTLSAAIEKANKEDTAEEDPTNKKKKGPPAKTKKVTANSTPTKGKRQSVRRQHTEENLDDNEAQKEQEATENDAEGTNDDAEGTKNDAEGTKNDDEKNEEGNQMDVDDADKDTPKETQDATEEANEDVAKTAEGEKIDTEQNSKEAEKTPDDTPKDDESNNKSKSPEKSKENDKPAKEERSPKKDKRSKEDKNSESDKSVKDDDSESAKESDKNPKQSTSKEKKEQDKKDKKSAEKSSKDAEKNGKESGKEDDAKEEKAKDNKEDKDKEESSVEPKAKRTRETKKTEVTPPPRSPAKRKSKF